MEGKFKKGKEVLVEKLELPKDVILDIPKIMNILKQLYIWNLKKIK